MQQRLPSFECGRRGVPAALLRRQREEATCELEVRTMPDLDRNGVHLHYEDVGSGLPLLLSHSWFCTGKQWPQVPDLVTAGYRVLNLDNRGHGRSGPYVEPYSLWEMSADLIAVLDHAGVDSAVLVGLSVGGFCSIRTALQHPERVRGLLRSFLSRDDVSYRLRDIAVPTLVIVGEEDVDPGVLASARIAARVPGARLEVLPAAGHLSAIEQPGEFTARLLDFLKTRLPTDLLRLPISSTVSSSGDCRRLVRGDALSGCNA